MLLRIGFIVVVLCFFTGLTMAIEEPKYTVLQQHDNFELRHYAARIIAETQLAGSIETSSHAAFSLIANYIFGNNRLANGENKKINMTTPVVLLKHPDFWTLFFIMPNEYSLSSLPTPNNNAVTLRTIPPSNYAVLEFSGLSGEPRVAEKIEELISWITSQGFKAVSEPELARYNPPWTLPFLRRNEIMIRYQ